MNTRKITENQENEILFLYYNGFVNMKKISNVVKCSVPTVSRIIGISFESKFQNKREYLILESKINV